MTKAPYFAPADGVCDATNAINTAIQVNIGTGKTVYLPNGTYKVSNTILFPNQAGGGVPARLTLQGQSEAGTILKLQNGCTGFGSSITPKAIVETGHDPAQCFSNNVRNLTINSGTGNSGAVGLAYYSNNTGTVSNVSIISGDGFGVSGLEFDWGVENGPLMAKYITVEGFGVGVSSANCQNSQTIEHLTVRNQKQYGVRALGGVLNIRDLVSNNAVQAVYNNGAKITILGASCTGGSSTIAAMSTNDVLYVRDFSAQGYGRGIDNTAGHMTNLTALSSAEWHSFNQMNLNTAGSGMLKLPIQETPEILWDPPSQWQAVNHPGDGTDATAAIQAAIDAGKTTVYFKNGSYKVNGTVYIRGNVKALYGFGSALDVQPTATLLVDAGTAPTVVFQNFGGGYASAFFVTQASSRTVVIKNVINWGVKKNTATGDVYLEDICANPWTSFEFNGGNVWARQINPENDGTHIVNNGANLWILGLKTERGGTLVETRSNGKTEICGFFSYTTTAPGVRPMFIVNESQFSVIGSETCNIGTPFTTFVSEIKSGVTTNLSYSSLPSSCGGRMLPYYVCKPVQTANAAPVINVGASATPSTVTGTTSNVSVTAHDPESGPSSLTYVWSKVSGPGVVTFAGMSSATTATFCAAGTYVLKVTVSDGASSVQSTVTVTVNQTATSILVVPASVVVAPNATAQFTAKSLDQFFNQAGTQPSFGWTVSGGGSINASGLFTAGSTNGGPYTVTATASSLSGTAQVTVGISHTIKLELVSTSLYLDKFEYYNGSTWIAVNQSDASIGYGGSWITESYCTDWAVALTAGAYVQLTFVGSAIRWYDPSDGIGQVKVYIDGGLDASVNTVMGTCPKIQYEKSGLGAAPNTAPVVATAAAASPSTVAATTSNLSVLGADDGGEGALTYTWAATTVPSGGTATFSVNGTNAAKASTATFNKAGSYTLQATIKDAGNLTATSSVNITVNQTLTTITVSPSTASVATSATQQFTAAGVDQFGAAMTATSTWTVTGGGSINTSGLFTAGTTAGGPYTVTATSGSKSGTATVTVTGAATALSRTGWTLSASRNTANAVRCKDGSVTTIWSTTLNQASGQWFKIDLGSAQAFDSLIMDHAAQASRYPRTYKVQSSTNNSTWVDVKTGIVGTTGISKVGFTAQNVRYFRVYITAAASSYWDIAEIYLYSRAAANTAPTIANAAAASPSTVTATTTNLSVLGADNAGEAALTYTWATTTVPSGGTATFSVNATNAAKNTVATFNKAGSYTLQATIRDAGNLTVTSSVNVTVSPTLTTVTVSPSTASVATSATRQFTAAGVDQFGAAMAATYTWTVSGGGSMSTSGLFTAGSTAGGPYTVTATSGSKSGTASVTVTTGAANHTIKLSAANLWWSLNKFQYYNGSSWVDVPSSSASITYVGTWVAGACAGNKIEEGSATSSASLTFSGTGIRVIDGDTNADPGTVTVTIDGVAQGTYTSTSNACTVIQKFEKSGL